ncbi:MAG: hypothetical protein ACQCN6_13630 [Candidatus Bathyarchaeia archaeon]|jgi:hypothetical protein
MNKSDKKEIITAQTSLKVNPPKANILPFDDGSKRKIMKKEPE